MSLAEELNPRAVIGGNLPPDFRALLAEEHAQLRHEVETVAIRANNAPKAVKTEEDLLFVGDIVRAARAVTKKADKARVTAKEPHLTACRDVDDYFKGLTDRLCRLVTALEERATDYQRVKAAEERRILEEQARKAREEEDRQRQIAEEAAASNRAGSALKHVDRAEEAAERARRAEAAAQGSAAELTRVRSETGTLATTRTGWDFAIEDAAKIPLDLLRPYIPRGDIEKAIRSFVRVNKGDVPLAGVRIFQEQKASFR